TELPCARPTLSRSKLESNGRLLPGQDSDDKSIQAAASAIIVTYSVRNVAPPELKKYGWEVNAVAKMGSFRSNAALPIHAGVVKQPMLPSGSQYSSLPARFGY
ncbi:MAG: hypothetical protein KDA84_01060, partial [Planctomycetaceae bacterium]|nr:hypothetical protein [Planctomycetaceae bacterium]